MKEINEKSLFELLKKDWDNIHVYREFFFGENFIEKYFKNLNKDFLSKFQRLSESFIETHLNDLNFYYISKYQHLSEAFIAEYFSKLNSYWVSRNQTLSENFIKNYSEKFNFSTLLLFQKYAGSLIGSKIRSDETKIKKISFFLKRFKFK